MKVLQSLETLRLKTVYQHALCHLSNEGLNGVEQCYNLLKHFADNYLSFQYKSLICSNENQLTQMTQSTNSNSQTQSNGSNYVNDEWKLKYLYALSAFTLRRYSESEGILLSSNKTNMNNSVDALIPNHSQSFLLLGQMCYKLNRYDESIIYLKKCLSIDSWNWSAFKTLSQIAAAQQSDIDDMFQFDNQMIKQQIVPCDVSAVASNDNWKSNSNTVSSQISFADYSSIDNSLSANRIVNVTVNNENTPPIVRGKLFDKISVTNQSQINESKLPLASTETICNTASSVTPNTNSSVVSLTKSNQIGEIKSKSDVFSRLSQSISMHKKRNPSIVPELSDANNSSNLHDSIVESRFINVSSVENTKITARRSARLAESKSSKLLSNSGTNELVINKQIVSPLTPAVNEQSNDVTFSKDGNNFDQQSNSTSTSANIHNDLNNEFFDLKTVQTHLRILCQSYRLMNRYSISSALELLFELNKSISNSHFIYSLIGKCYSDLGQYKESLKYFEKQLKIYSYSFYNIEIYSSVLWHLKRDIELSLLCQHYTTYLKYNYKTYIICGNLFSLRSEQNLCIIFFNYALKLCYNNSDYILTLLGHESYSSELYDNAIKYYRRSLLINSTNNYYSYFGLGQIYLKQELYELSLYYFNRSIEINSQNTILLYYTSECELKLNNLINSLNTLNDAEIINQNLSQNNNNNNSQNSNIKNVNMLNFIFNNIQIKYQKLLILIKLNKLFESLKLCEELISYAPREQILYLLKAKIQKQIIKQNKSVIKKQINQQQLNSNKYFNNSHLNNLQSSRQKNDQQLTHQRLSNLQQLDQPTSQQLSNRQQLNNESSQPNLSEKDQDTISNMNITELQNDLINSLICALECCDGQIKDRNSIKQQIEKLQMNNLEEEGNQQNETDENQ